MWYKSNHNAKIRKLISSANFLILIFVSFFFQINILRNKLHQVITFVKDNNHITSTFKIVFIFTLQFTIKLVKFTPASASKKLRNWKIGIDKLSVIQNNCITLLSVIRATVVRSSLFFIIIRTRQIFDNHLNYKHLRLINITLRQEYIWNKYFA